MPENKGHIACRRCGVVRATKSGRPLCSDCKGSLSYAELAEWYDDPPVWLKKRLEAA